MISDVNLGASVLCDEFEYLVAITLRDATMRGFGTMREDFVQHGNFCRENCYRTCYSFDALGKYGGVGWAPPIGPCNQ